MFAGDLGDPISMTRDERNVGALRVQTAHERETETRCAAGDRHARVDERIGGHL